MTEVNYLPRQLCVVCNPSAANPADYDVVRTWLNHKIDQYLATSPTHPPDGIDPADLNPATTRGIHLAHPGIQWLQPVPPAAIPPRTVDLPSRGGGGPDARLHFYAVDPTDLASHDVNDPVVRELVNLVNWELVMRPDPEDKPHGWELLAATPDWLSAVQQHTSGGPAALPEVVSPGDVPNWPNSAGKWTFDFTGRLQSVVAAARDDPASTSDIVVAIIDTLPEESAVTAVAKPGHSFAPNQLLQALQPGPQVIYEARGVAPNYLPRYSANARHKLTNGPVANLSDHGLSVAGMVRDIAPGAELHLFRGLNHAGAGDLHALVYLLAGLPQHLGVPVPLAGEGAKRLVVNLSLCVDVLPGEYHFLAWLPKTVKAWAASISLALTAAERKAFARAFADADFASALSGLGGKGREVSEFLDLTHRSLDLVTKSLHDWGALVVAAAGNDNQELDSRPGVANVFETLVAAGITGGLFEFCRRPEPRLPARYDHVLGVGAVNGSDIGSVYSNRADVPTMGNGIAALGGDTIPVPGREHAAKAPPNVQSSQTDAIRGVGVAATPGAGGVANQCGWLCWAGTSFAAPIISAIAADYWPTRLQLDPAAVIDLMRHSFGQPLLPDPNGTLDCPYVEVHQTYK